MSAPSEAEIRSLLAARDLALLTRREFADQTVLRTLLMLTFDADELIGWRAVEAVGKVAGAVAAGEVERVRRFLRRLLWSMNDESGGVGWRAPECIGEILVNVPSLIGEYGPLLMSHRDSEPFERGSHLAVYRVARCDSTPFRNDASELSQSLDHADPAVRGYAALALGAIGAVEHRQGVQALRHDHASVSTYDFESGELRKRTVLEMVEEAIGLMGRGSDVR